MSDLTLFGAHISPYVRKIRLVLSYKELQYVQIPVIPVSPDKPKEFVDNSPLGKIPLFKVGNDYITDSSVIGAFIEREYPQKPLLPSNNLLAAKALWFEEYADSKLVSVVGGHLFAERILAKALFKREPIQSDIDLAINIELPEIFTYLETQLDNDFLVGSEFTLADLSVCGVFVSMMHSDVSCDKDKWPKLASYIDRVFSMPLFQQIISEEKNILKMLLKD